MALLEAPDTVHCPSCGKVIGIQAWVTDGVSNLATQGATLCCSHGGSASGQRKAGGPFGPRMLGAGRPSRVPRKGWPSSTPSIRWRRRLPCLVRCGPPGSLMAKARGTLSVTPSSETLKASRVTFGGCVGCVPPKPCMAQSATAGLPKAAFSSTALPSTATMSPGPRPAGTPACWRRRQRRRGHCPRDLCRRLHPMQRAADLGRHFHPRWGNRPHHHPQGTPKMTEETPPTITYTPAVVTAATFERVDGTLDVCMVVYMPGIAVESHFVGVVLPCPNPTCEQGWWGLLAELGTMKVELNARPGELNERVCHAHEQDEAIDWLLKKATARLQASLGIPEEFQGAQSDKDLAYQQNVLNGRNSTIYEA